MCSRGLVLLLNAFCREHVYFKSSEMRGLSFRILSGIHSSTTFFQIWMFTSATFTLSLLVSPSPCMRIFSSRCPLTYTDREIEIVEDLSTRVLEFGKALSEACDVCAELDCLLSFAEASRVHDYQRPRMVGNNVIHIKGGRSVHMSNDTTPSLCSVPATHFKSKS
jgi:hypothetical protein